MWRRVSFTGPGSVAFTPTHSEGFYSEATPQEWPWLYSGPKETHHPHTPSRAHTHTHTGRYIPVLFHFVVRRPEETTETEHVISTAIEEKKTDICAIRTVEFPRETSHFL